MELPERPTEAFGEIKTIRQWSKDHRCSVTYPALWNRIARLGWPPELAITTAKKNTGRRSK